jgi:Staphylococcal nuclease homologue
MTKIIVERDRHGRLVAKVFSPNGVDIGRRLVLAGWALAYRRYSTDYVDTENQARKARRGMWRGTFVNAWMWRASSPPRRTQAPSRIVPMSGARQVSGRRRQNQVDCQQGPKEPCPGRFVGSLNERRYGTMAQEIVLRPIQEGLQARAWPSPVSAGSFAQNREHDVAGGPRNGRLRWHNRLGFRVFVGGECKAPCLTNCRRTLAHAQCWCSPAWSLSWSLSAPFW